MPLVHGVWRHEIVAPSLWELKLLFLARGMDEYDSLYEI
jgi:hypothetical protein